MNDNASGSNYIFHCCGQNILYMYSLLKISIMEFVTIMFLVISHYEIIFDRIISLLLSPRFLWSLS